MASMAGEWAGPLGQMALTGRSCGSFSVSRFQLICTSFSRRRKRFASGPCGISTSMCDSPTASRGVQASCQPAVPVPGCSSQRAGVCSSMSSPSSASNGAMAWIIRSAMGASTARCGVGSSIIRSVVSRKVTGCSSQPGAAVADGVSADACRPVGTVGARPVGTEACAVAKARTAATAPAGIEDATSAGCSRSQRSWAQSLSAGAVNGSVRRRSRPSARAWRMPGSWSCSRPPPSQCAGNRAPGSRRSRGRATVEVFSTPPGAGVMEGSVAFTPLL